MHMITFQPQIKPYLSMLIINTQDIIIEIQARTYAHMESYKPTLNTRLTLNMDIYGIN